MSTGQAVWATPLLAALLVIGAAGFLFFADPIPAERPPLQKPVPKTTEALPPGPLKDIMHAGAMQWRQRKFGPLSKRAHGPRRPGWRSLIGALLKQRVSLARRLTLQDSRLARRKLLPWLKALPPALKRMAMTRKAG